MLRPDIGDDLVPELLDEDGASQRLANTTKCTRTTPSNGSSLGLRVSFDRSTLKQLQHVYEVLSKADFIIFDYSRL